VITQSVIHRVTTLDLSLQPRPWLFADARRADIDAHFALKQSEKSQIWNGRVLLGRNPVFTGDCFSADYFETDFASFLAWRDWGSQTAKCGSRQLRPKASCKAAICRASSSVSAATMAICRLGG
jgi:hypothetical protein